MFNSETFISGTINSVISQTFSNWELLLIDDFSNDTTVQTVEAFIEGNSRIKLINNEENLGAAISRNKGIKMAKGEYIAFLDADDLWKPEKLEKQLRFMQNENCDVCFSTYDQIDESGTPLNIRVMALPVLTYKKLLKSNYIGNLTGIYNKSVIGEILAPNLHKRQDWLLWLAAIKKSGEPAKSVSESLAYYRVRNNSMSSNKLNLIKYNYWVYKRGLGYSTLKSIYCLLVFFKEHFFVKSRQVVSINKT